MSLHQRLRLLCSTACQTGEPSQPARPARGNPFVANLSAILGMSNTVGHLEFGCSAANLASFLQLV